MQWFYDLKTVHKIGLLLVVMAVSLITVGFTGYYFNSQADKSLGIMYNDNLKPIRWINLFRITLNANKVNQLEIIMEEDPQLQAEYVQNIKERTAEGNKDLADFKKAMEDVHNEKALALLEDIEQNLVDYRASREKTIELALAGDKEKAFENLKAGEPLFQTLVKDVGEAASNIADRADQRFLKNQEEGEFAAMFILTTSIIALCLCAWLGWMTATRIVGILGQLGDRMKSMSNGDLTVRKLGRPEKSDIGDACVIFDTMLENLYTLVKEVNRSVDDITSGSEEMTAAAEQTAQGAQQVSTSVTQLAAGSQEQANSVSKSVDKLTGMNKVIHKIYEHADNVVQLANSADDGAQKGYSEAEKAIKKINQIKDTATATSETANKLGTLGSEIEQIVDLIKGIAGQTNLLALNAAIEAARAGEHGKGFAVVADEVKKLAGESSNATDKITEIVKQVQTMTNNVVTDMDISMKEIDEGVVTIDNVGTVLNEILNVAQTVSKQAQEVVNVSNVLVKDSEEVAGMMEGVASITEESAASAEEISSITEEQTASVEEINASSQSLTKIAENLQRQVASFRI